MDFFMIIYLANYPQNIVTITADDKMNWTEKKNQKHPRKIGVGVCMYQKSTV